MSAIDQISAARNDAFAGRVLFISLKVAQNVVAEDPGTASHAERVAYADRVIRGEDRPKLIAAHVIASNPTIAAAIDAQPAQFGANVPDGDIEFALASIWTARALAFAT